MKKLILTSFLLFTTATWAESPCDVKIGESLGVKVLRFTSGPVVHSKMLLTELSTGALSEEMANLRDEGICNEQMPTRKCILKFEKTRPKTTLSLYRDGDKWTSWEIASKREAQVFVKSLQRAGFCS
jgi:hypothetical protein